MPQTTKPEAVDVEIRRTLDISLLAQLDEERASSEDGLEVNHAYIDVRGYGFEDGELLLSHEADFLDDLDKAGWTTDEAEEIIDDFLSNAFELSPFDAGMGGAVIALSVAGAIPISSCNGGTIGQSSHAEALPSILFAASKDIKPTAIYDAAKEADLGLIPNGEFAELYADHVLKFHRFAQILLENLRASK
ncbi:hypothetical protein [Mesorhizobium sp. M0088]|uniref:hypothetical protein n=1 Tax=Mesorhizobium sp. M0088 TaxID=2956873 RepID=UPI00333DE602